MSYNAIMKNNTYLKGIIARNDTILLHGGGNFGDLYRFHVNNRNFVIYNFPSNKIIILPQTINYKNEKLAHSDYALYSNATDLIVSARSFESFNFSVKNFPKIRTLFVPDMAFMVGNVKPIAEPTYDILVIRRIDKEKNFLLGKWTSIFNHKFNGKYKYIIRDWFDYQDVKNYKNLQELGERRVILMNKIISQARLVITDRLHASIMSLLMGKPHIIINEKYNKIINTRKSAFDGKSECQSRHLNEHYVEDINQAAHLAKFLLDYRL